MIQINEITLMIDQFDNAAMADSPAAEVSRILRELAARVDEMGVVNVFDGLRLMDSNGNAVGRCKCDWETTGNGDDDEPNDPLYDILMSIDEDDPEAIEAAENCGLGWTREAEADIQASDAHRRELLDVTEGLVNTIDGWQWRNHDGETSPLGS